MVIWFVSTFLTIVSNAAVNTVYKCLHGSMSSISFLMTITVFGEERNVWFYASEGKGFNSKCCVRASRLSRYNLRWLGVGRQCSPPLPGPTYQHGSQQQGHPSGHSSWCDWDHRPSKLTSTCQAWANLAHPTQRPHNSSFPDCEVERECLSQNPDDRCWWGPKWPPNVFSRMTEAGQ